jgi:hypothetical protein
VADGVVDRVLLAEGDEVRVLVGVADRLPVDDGVLVARFVGVVGTVPVGVDVTVGAGVGVGTGPWLSADGQGVDVGLGPRPKGRRGTRGAVLPGRVMTPTRSMALTSTKGAMTAVRLRALASGVTEVTVPIGIPRT